MYVWTNSNVGLILLTLASLLHASQPRRDGDLDNGILIHEVTHGTSNRMTGGGTGRCLQTLEAAGMGEGWSDAYAEYVHIGFPLQIRGWTPR